MEYIILKMEIDMKETGKMIKEMEKVFSYFMMERNMKENLKI